MIKEEALNNLYGLSNSTNPKLVDTYLVEKLIESIYNDLENRVCKNCKWFNKLALVGYSCNNNKNKKIFGGYIYY